MHICSVLFRPYDILPTRIVHTQPMISVTYLIFTAELTHGLACSDSIYIVLIFLLLVHTAIKDWDLELLDLESCSFSGLGLELEASGLGLGCCWTRYKSACSKRMRSSGIDGEGELRGQPSNAGSPGKMAVKTRVCVLENLCCTLMCVCLRWKSC